LSQQQGQVISVDPLYQFAAPEIQARIEETFPIVLAQVRRNMQDFVWSSIADVDDLGRVRMEAMQDFLADYRQGRDKKRYRTGTLPALDFPAQHFDLALCSHLLFLYSEQCSRSFHIRSVLELCRVAGEVRVFPLVDLTGSRSCHLDAVLEAIEAREYVWSVEEVNYEFQRGGNQMLRIIISS
jgi:hypothetical protein